MPANPSNRPRISEWILGGYFAYTLVLSFVIPLQLAPRSRICIASLLALGVLHYVVRIAPQYVPAVVRNLLPMPGVLLAYTQMGWFATPHESTALEESWLRWDRMLLENWQLTESIEALGGLLPGLLELLYLLTYAMGPIGLLVLYLTDRVEGADKYLALFVASAVGSYALYPYFPSEPPRTVFPGDMYGQYDTIFRKLNWWILGKGGIHTSVFPSGHVSSTFGAGLGLLYSIPERKRFGIAMLLLAVGIAVATVYGRYHYAVDAVAGIAVSCGASAACVVAFRRRVAAASS